MNVINFVATIWLQLVRRALVNMREKSRDKKKKFLTRLIYTKFFLGLKKEIVIDSLKVEKVQ